MTPHTPSGQQAVEQMLREEICRMTGWNLSKDDCRNIVEKIHSAAPTAPSTAAGEPALVCGCGWEGSYADLNETAEGMTCPKCRLSRNMDCAATPPAPTVPWEEQAARIRNDALEEAAKIADIAAEECEPPSNGYLKACQNEAISIAERIRALLSKPAKGEG